MNYAEAQQERHARGSCWERYGASGNLKPRKPEYWMSLGNPSDEIVYFIQGKSGGAVKIGTTTRENLKKRVASIQTGNPEKLQIRHIERGGRGLEQLLHERFRSCRIRKNGEWFIPNEEMRAEFGVWILAPVELGIDHLTAIRNEGFRDGWRRAGRYYASRLRDDAIAALRLTHQIGELWEDDLWGSEGIGRGQ